MNKNRPVITSVRSLNSMSWVALSFVNLLKSEKTYEPTSQEQHVGGMH